MSGGGGWDWGGGWEGGMGVQGCGRGGSALDKGTSFQFSKRVIKMVDREIKIPNWKSHLAFQTAPRPEDGGERVLPWLGHWTVFSK